MRSDMQRMPGTTRSDILCERSRNELRVIFPSAPLAVRDALHSTMSGLAHLDLTDEDHASVELVLAEVLNNIVEHGYGDDQPGMIELRVVHSAEGLFCTAIDDGQAMPGNRPPMTDPPSPDVPMMAMAEGGFGWFLIRELSRDLTYRRDAGRNELAFRLELGRKVQSC